MGIYKSTTTTDEFKKAIAMKCFLDDKLPIVHRQMQDDGRRRPVKEGGFTDCKVTDFQSSDYVICGISKDVRYPETNETLSRGSSSYTISGIKDMFIEEGVFVVETDKEMHTNIDITPQYRAIAYAPRAMQRGIDLKAISEAVQYAAKTGDLSELKHLLAHESYFSGRAPLLFGEYTHICDKEREWQEYEQRGYDENGERLDPDGTGTYGIIEPTEIRDGASLYIYDVSNMVSKVYADFEETADIQSVEAHFVADDITIILGNNKIYTNIDFSNELKVLRLQHFMERYQGPIIEAPEDPEESQTFTDREP